VEQPFSSLFALAFCSKAEIDPNLMLIKNKQLPSILQLESGAAHLAEN
jgi:hypothetical protein